MYFLPASDASTSALSISLSPTDAGQFDQHGKVDTGNDFDGAALHDRDRQVGGRAAKHIGEYYNAIAFVGCKNSVQNILPALIHIILGADADSLDRLLRTNDMLQRMTKLFSQLAVCDKHEVRSWCLRSNCICKSIRRVRYRNASNFVHL